MISLRNLLIVPFLLQIFAAVGIVGWLSFKNGQDAVNQVSKELRQEIADRIKERLTSYLTTPHLLQQLHANALHLNILNPNDFAQMEHYFWQQGQPLSLDIGTVAYGNNLGEFVGANKPEGYTVIANAETGRAIRRYAVDQNGKRLKIIREKPNYDARTRGWYKTAVKAGKPVWSKIEPSALGNRLDISAVTPVFNPQQVLQGVLLTDLSLGQISSFLSSLEIGKTGQAFILERSGLIVANSTQEPIFSTAGGKDPQRLKASDSKNPILKASIAKLENYNASNLEQQLQLDLTIDGARHFLQVLPYKDRNGIDWLILVNIPESDFMSEIQANNKQTIFLIVITLLLATGIGLITAKWIVSPVLRLNRASKAMAEGERVAALPANSIITELNSLSISFNQMAWQLHQDLDRKSAELQDKAYWLNTLIEAIPNPIFLKDREGKYLIINYQGLELFELWDINYLGKTDAEIADLKLFYHDALLYCAARDEIVWNQKTISYGEQYIPQPNGSERIFDVIRVPLFNQDGSRKGLVVVGQDISDRKRSEIELARAKEAAEASTRAKSQFLANMSHEIRTPMNGVLGMAEILANTQLNPDQQDFVQTLRDSGEALLTIINDILDFSKIESGMLNLEERTFGLEDILNAVCSLLRIQTRDKGISLEYVIAPNTPTTLVGDDSRLRQILLNIVGNAVKFTNKGKVSIDISYAQTSATDPISDQPTNQSKCYLQFAVKDTGEGIPSDRINKLFQPFTQADASINRKYGGTGLGLAICKRLTELMGGTIWVESSGHIGGDPPVDWEVRTSTQGSVFYFTVLLGTVFDREDGNDQQGGEVSLINISRSLPLRILLAEDNLVNQKVASFLLKKLGFTPDIANNGQEVLDLLKQQAYDVILMDMQMPEIDGIAATKIIREQMEFQPWIIAVTANAFSDDRQSCLEAGMNDFIAKPLQVKDIENALSNYYRQSLSR